MFGNFQIDDGSGYKENACLTRIPLHVFEELKKGNYRFMKGKGDSFSLINEKGQEIGVVLPRSIARKLDDSNKDFVVEHEFDETFNTRFTIISDASFLVSEEGPFIKEYESRKSASKVVLGPNELPETHKKTVPSFLKGVILDPVKCEEYLAEIRSKIYDAQKVIEKKFFEINLEMAKSPQNEVDESAIASALSDIEMSQKIIDIESDNEKTLRQNLLKYIKGKETV